MAKLTPKQEKFCQCIVKGINQSDAYRQAYDCDNAKIETVNNNAYMLMNRSDIKARIAELNKKIEEKLIYTALQSFNKLKEIQDLALNNSRKDLGSALKAEELCGKLGNLYKPEVQPSTIVINVDKEDDKI